MPQSPGRGVWAAHALLIFVTLIWGATFTLTKQALASVGVYAFLSLRFAIEAFATLCLAVMLRRKPSGRTDKRVWLVGAAAGLPLGASFLLQTDGLRSITPGLSGFLTGLNVAMVPLLTSAIARERLGLRTWSAVGLACAGLALLCAGSKLAGRADGVVETILCALCVALQIVIVDRWAKGLDSLVVAAVEIWTTASYRGSNPFGCATSPSNGEDFGTSPFFVVHGLLSSFCPSLFAGIGLSSSTEMSSLS